MNPKSEHAWLSQLIDLESELLPYLARLNEFDEASADKVIELINALVELTFEQSVANQKMYKKLKERDLNIFNYLYDKAIGYSEKEIKAFDDGLKFSFNDDNQRTLLQRIVELKN